VTRGTLVRIIALVIFAPAPAAGGPEKYLDKPADWYRGEQATRIAANILSYQSPEGSWPKNIDTTAGPYVGEPGKLRGTFDNGATTGELRFLARMRQATGDERYERAVLRGLDHVLKAQYPTGGWPQYYPPPKTYHRHITFNDNAMVRVMELVRDVGRQDRFGFVDAERRKAASTAFDRGVQCILKCQIRVAGKRTAWCAQHDEADYSPRPGRSYELVSLSGAESVGIVRLLMSLDNPSPEVVRAVEEAVAWFESAKLEGIRVVLEPDKTAPKGRNKVVVKDPKAAPLWARFYEIETNKPIFADRDGVKRYALADIGSERRNGYAWYGTWPQVLLEKDYPAWKRKWVETTTPKR
jgi:PelA/Pel-15E family pectate lyase